MIPPPPYRSVAVWFCPGCGRVEAMSIGARGVTHMPNTICNCGTYGSYWRMIPNDVARAMEESQERYWRVEREARARAEERLLDWPPAATPEDWHLRRSGRGPLPL